MVELIVVLNIFRLIIGIMILGYASYTDLRTRHASDFLWIIMAACGIFFIIIQYFFVGFENFFYLLFIPLMILFMYLLFQVRLVFGGADAKALMAIAVLLPLQPVIPPLPIFPIPLIAFPGSWIVFSNSVLLFLFIPLSLFIYNIIQGDLAFPFSFLGYRMPVSIAKTKFVWPLEKIKNGKRIFSYRPSTFDVKEEFILLEKHNIDTVWVTPKIPFMIPLLAGFIAAFFLGDILTQLLQSII